MLDVEVVRRYTGQDEILDPSDADWRNREAEEYLRFIRRRSVHCCCSHLLALLRTYPSRLKLPLWVFTLVVSLAIGFALAVGSIVEGAGLLGVFVLFALGSATAAAVTYASQRDEAGENDGNRAFLRSARFESAQAKRDTIVAEAEIAKARQRNAKALVSNFQRAAQSRINNLLHVDCRVLTGTQFEYYIADIFAELGYDVRRIGQTGDQGVDLVVVTPTGCVAVQAKCYSTTVGNFAVQEAFAGMRYHECQRCVVITNSTFTSSARELAQKVGCRLVEGPELPGLIRGGTSI
jgi:hypothetical protein